MTPFRARSFALAASLAAFWSSQACAESYDFTRLATTPFGSNGVGTVVLNNQGEVAYTASGVSPDFSTTIYRASTTSAPTRIDSRYGIPSSVSINDAGSVGYTKSPLGQTDTALMVNDGTGSSILLGENPPSLGFNRTSINAQGAVVTSVQVQTGPGSLSGVYAGSFGQAATRIYSPNIAGGLANFGTSAIVNDASQVAFIGHGDFGTGAFDNTATTAILVGDLAGGSPTVVARNADFSQINGNSGSIHGQFDMNNHGDIIFTESHKTGPADSTLINNIHVISGGGNTQLVATNAPGGGFTGFSENGAAINDSGKVAFFAYIGFSDGGIYTGSNLLSDRVIGLGDQLDGGTVIDLIFGSGGLNDLGQIAFFATVSDGNFNTRSGIYLATLPTPAVPEPSTLCMLGTGLVAGTFAARRARATSNAKPTFEA